MANKHKQVNSFIILLSLIFFSLLKFHCKLIFLIIIRFHPAFRNIIASKIRATFNYRQDVEGSNWKGVTKPTKDFYFNKFKVKLLFSCLFSDFLYINYFKYFI